MYHVRSVSTEGFDADPEWRASIVGDVICEHCFCINRSRFPRAIDAVLLNAPETRPTKGLLFIEHRCQANAG